MRRSLAVLTAVFLVAACGNDPAETEPTETPTTTEAATEAPAALTVGGASVLSVTADDTTYSYDVTGIRAEDVAGVSHVLAEVTITVTAGELSFISGWHPGLTPVLVADGIEYEQSGYGTPGMFDGPVTGTASGTVGFEAPAAAAETGVFRLEVASLSGADVHEWTY